MNTEEKILFVIAIISLFTIVFVNVFKDIYYKNLGARYIKIIKETEEKSKILIKVINHTRDYSYALCSEDINSMVNLITLMIPEKDIKVISKYYNIQEFVKEILEEEIIQSTFKSKRERKVLKE